MNKNKQGKNEQEAAENLNTHITEALENADREILIGIIKKLATPEDTGNTEPDFLSFYTSSVIMRAYADAMRDYFEKLANAH